MPKTRSRHVIVVDNSALAARVGGRIRDARLRAKQSQADLSRGRYTSAYISALERGLAKPSMAALSFISERLGVPMRDLLGDDQLGPSRLDADILLASGSWQEALDRYQALLDEPNERHARAEILRGIAEALCRLDRGSEAIAPAAEAAELFQGIGLAADAAWARYWLAYAHYQVDNPAEARSVLQELLDRDRAGLQVAPDFRFRLLTALANVEAWDGLTDRALVYMEEARALTEGVDLRQRAAFLSGLALQYRKAGDFERSLRAGMQSLALYRSADAELEQASLANNLAMTYMEVGSLRQARKHVEEAREVAQRHGDTKLLSHVADTEAQLAWRAGDMVAAEERIAAALALAEESGSPVAASTAHLTRARIARDAGDLARASTAFEAAASILREAGPRHRLREILSDWAGVLSERGELAAANKLYAEALAL